MALAPIILFVYNRPWHTRQTVEALANNELAEKSDLIIYSDGPKTDADKPAVDEVRQYIHGLVGFKKIIIRERNKNFGLADSIISGVTEVVNEYDRVIVLEDDLVTSPFFLRYMNDALDKYENNDAVMQISGYMFPVDTMTDKDAFFLPFTTTWGWGTWKRAWQFFDPGMKGFDTLRTNKELRYRFNLNGTYNYFQMLFDKKKQKNDSWGILWYASVFFNKGIVLFPVQTLASQIGFDESGRHCGGTGLPQQRLSEKTVVIMPERAAVSGTIYEDFLKDFRMHNKQVKRLQRLSDGRKLFASMFIRVKYFFLAKE